MKLNRYNGDISRVSRWSVLSILWIALLCMGVGYGTVYGQGINKTRHNLSAGSPGDLKSGDTTMICIFCHVSHQGTPAAPLWNRENGAPIYTVYNSSTMKAIPGQPDGTSKLCLSCHDGTIALGSVIKPPAGMNALNPSIGRIPHGKRANLGIDLSDDHPVSFETTLAVSQNLELNHPAPGDPVRYDENGKIQCTSCHDPHNDLYGNFLVKDNHGSAICKVCHEPTGYAGISTHDISTATWNGSGQNPWPHTQYSTVAGNSCLNCHQTHAAGGKHRLLSRESEEGVCLICHDGSVGSDIDSVLKKTSAHRVKFYSGVHDPTENILTAANHVECVDCHNPHRLRGMADNAPNVGGKLEGVSGMTVTGSLVAESQYQYQVCFKCHGQQKYKVNTPVKRMLETSDLRMAFNPTNASYHAVVNQGTAANVPSLKPPYTSSSRLYCTDCHNNSDVDGPRGPHGSRWNHLLERRYEIGDYTPWTEANYDLCFKCHDPILLMEPTVSGFEYHDTHVRDQSTPCSVCHDPHGSTQYPGLLNFDTNVVMPNLNGQLKFEVMGDKGRCYLQCHGADHGPREYRRK